MAKEFSFEDDPNMEWKGEPPKPTICSKCVNKMPNGCESKTLREMIDAIRDGKCDSRIEL